MPDSTKNMNNEKAQCKEPELTTLINEGVVAQIYKASKLAFYNANLSPRSSSARVATGPN